jgi:hypothetical protein
MLSLVYSLLVSTRTPLAHTPTTLLLLILYISRAERLPPPAAAEERKAEQKRSQIVTFGYQSSLKSVRHGGSSAQKASSRPECLRVNIPAFELASRPAGAYTLYALRLSGASTLLVPDARPESAARLDRFPSPRPHPRAWPSHRRPPQGVPLCSFFFASFKENVFTSCIPWMRHKDKRAWIATLEFFTPASKPCH